jgi:large subunit ribosomal protein L24
MKSVFSKTWKRSVQPRKQRKYSYNAPLQVQKKVSLSSPLSKELRTKYGRRSLTLRKDDTVKILRGQFKGKSGKVTKVNVKDGKVYVEGIENIKKDGTKSMYPLRASNLMLTSLFLDDKKRKAILERKKENKNG